MGVMMMSFAIRRFLVCLGFNGSAYCGWQVQKNGLSVQQVVQTAIEGVCGFKPSVVACSRTDSGVHANRFYFHMDVKINIEPDRFKFALNRRLPDDVAVREVRIVSANFHARYDAKKKEYVYRIWNSSVKNPFLKNLALQYARKIDFEKIESASKFLIGTHDFSAFCSSKSSVKNKIRTIFSIKLRRCGEMVEFWVVGSGFLHNMVRIVVGTLLKVSEGLIEVDDVQKIVESGNRNFAGKTVLPIGLYLNEVFY